MVLLTALLPSGIARAAEMDFLRTVAELQRAVFSSDQAVVSFELEGIVCSVHGGRRLITFQDHSGIALLEVPTLATNLQAGDWVSLKGEFCTLTRSSFGLQLGTGPVVETRSTHSYFGVSGKAFLDSGRQPLCLEWHNNDWEIPALRLEFEGPDSPRRSITHARLWRMNSGNFQPGLDYAHYFSPGWTTLPDFKTLQPAATGVTTELDVRLAGRTNNAALVFSGFVEITNAGVYAFHLQASDLSRLFVGTPASRCSVTILSRSDVEPRARTIVQALTEGRIQEWVTAEGKVTFASHHDGELRFELAGSERIASVRVIDPSGLRASELQHQSVRVRGLGNLRRDSDTGSTPLILIADASQLEVIDSYESFGEESEMLTAAAQVRSLQPSEARRGSWVRLRGVTTMGNHWSCVVKDLSGAVFVRHVRDRWETEPRAGELWEFEGFTDPGDFSPVVRATNAVYLGRAALPEPIHPTREQLLNGSLDAELVEIQAAILDISRSEMSLLTREGRVKLLGKTFYPLPYGPYDYASRDRLLGSIVRMRGVFTAEWDTRTRRLSPGKFYLGNAMLSIDEPAPANPFAAPTKRAADLLLFTSHIGALTRVKISGQVLHAQPREVILMDGTIGMRVLTREAMALKEGDIIEAVGFPDLNGPSPTLQEAQARKIAAAQRPSPIALSVTHLSERSHDATLVQLEALLISDNLRLNQRVLELQAGPHHFLARVTRTSGADPQTLRRGSRLQLTGIYSAAREDRAGNDLDAFELLVNRESDVVVLRQGPWWTVRHTIATISVLFAGLVAALVWVRLLQRTVSQRTSQLKREIEQRQTLEQRRLMEQERTRVAQDLHDELGAGLAEVGILGAMARNPAIAQEKKAAYLDRLTEVSRLLVTGLDEIVWAINPKQDSSASVSSYLCDYAQEFLRATSISCRLDVSRQQPAFSLSSHQRHQLFLAFKEALTNVVKHSGATEVWIRISGEANSLWVTVEDNGSGLHRGSNGNGASHDGFESMTSRLQRIGGTCEIQNRSEGGVRVRFTLTNDILAKN